MWDRLVPPVCMCEDWREVRIERFRQLLGAGNIKKLWTLLQRPPLGTRPRAFLDFNLVRPHHLCACACVCVSYFSYCCDKMLWQRNFEAGLFQLTAPGYSHHCGKVKWSGSLSIWHITIIVKREQGMHAWWCSTSFPYIYKPRCCVQGRESEDRSSIQLA